MFILSRVFREEGNLQRERPPFSDCSRFCAAKHTQKSLSLDHGENRLEQGGNVSAVKRERNHTEKWRQEGEVVWRERKKSVRERSESCQRVAGGALVITIRGPSCSELVIIHFLWPRPFSVLDLM